MPNDTLPLATRLWFAWLCFFRVLFDGRFALAAWDARSPARLPPPSDPPPVRAGSLSGTASPAAVASAEPPAGGREAPGLVRETAASLAPALRLLSLLQREGRFVDFLQQDIGSFADTDVGVAARVVHEGCRRALRAHLTVEPVRAEAEGDRVTLPSGFDADAVKLIGDLKGAPPYAGVLRHRGWRASNVKLPQTVGEHDERILAPAEVELG